MGIFPFSRMHDGRMTLVRKSDEMGEPPGRMPV